MHRNRYHGFHGGTRGDNVEDLEELLGLAASG
jgi:hypothetical protein